MSYQAPSTIVFWYSLAASSAAAFPFFLTAISIHEMAPGKRENTTVWLLIGRIQWSSDGSFVPVYPIHSKRNIWGGFIAILFLWITVSYQVPTSFVFSLSLPASSVVAISIFVLRNLIAWDCTGENGNCHREIAFIKSGGYTANTSCPPIRYIARVTSEVDSLQFYSFGLLWIIMCLQWLSSVFCPFLPANSAVAVDLLNLPSQYMGWYRTKWRLPLWDCFYRTNPMVIQWPLCARIFDSQHA